MTNAARHTQLEPVSPDNATLINAWLDSRVHEAITHTGRKIYGTLPAGLVPADAVPEP